MIHSYHSEVLFKNTKKVSWRALHGSCLDVPDTIPWIEFNNKKHLPRTHNNHHYEKLGKISPL